ncbi:MAG TPA: hypothetical protein VK824_08455 [Planctomycetota bacterium]|nr:hypothetical protein [Planctomycetota bacterium]
MDFLQALWLPILLSAVAVFVVSSLVHMLLPIHKGDFAALPNEDKVLASLRSNGVGPGAYMFPHCDSMKAMGTPEMKAKLAQGPVGSLIVRGPDGVSMGKALLQWFLFTVVVSAVVAVITWSTQPYGADSHAVFHLVALVSFLAYALSNVTDSIWKGVPWGVTFKFMIDGFLYALATAAVFAWLWPAAA